MKQALAFLSVAALALLAGCGGSTDYMPLLITPGAGDAITTRDQARQRGKWTFLVYLDADNDLESVGIANFNQMEAVGSTKDLRIVVQMDRIAGHNTSEADWDDTRRFLIIRDADTTTMRSIRLDDQPLGEVDMADWRSLRDFVEWGKREFPAEHYCLVMWDHGTGWQVRSESVTPEHRYIIADDTSYTHMDVTHIPLALSGLGMDVIAFDACLMQQLEVAYEIRDCARYMVGSPAAEPSPGYNYQTLLSLVSSTTTPELMCRAIVDAYAQTYPAPKKAITQTAVDLSRMSDIAAAADRFARAMIAAAPQLPGLSDARRSALNYSTADGGINRYYLDIIDYARRCADLAGPAAQQAAAALESAIAGAIIAEFHNPDTPAARGLAVYAPPSTLYDGRYESLRLAADTSWDEWLRSQGQ